MMDTCPECGTKLKPMAGCSAHPDNWYCANWDCAWRCKGQTAPGRPAMLSDEQIEAIYQQYHDG